jgi:hypothetical protein
MSTVGEVGGDLLPKIFGKGRFYPVLVQKNISRHYIAETFYHPPRPFWGREYLDPWGVIPPPP